MLSRILPDRIVLALTQTDFQDVFGLMSRVSKPPSQRSGQLRVNEKAHRLGVDEHRVIDLLCGELETSTNVFQFKKFVIFQNSSFGDSRSQQIEHILYPNAIMANARPSAALLRVKRDALRVFHADTVAAVSSLLKQWF
jgi:hypothetical protein